MGSHSRSQAELVVPLGSRAADRRANTHNNKAFITPFESSPGDVHSSYDDFVLRPCPGNLPR